MKILLADDDPDLLLSTQIMVTDWGYEVVTAADGREALRLLQQDDAPRLALLDWMMPGLDGPAVCRELRQDAGRPYTYILLLTARAGKGDTVTGLEAGADDYLIKPVDPNELRARLSTGRRIVELQNELLAAREALRLRAAQDPLTGLWNRAAILELLDGELSRARREGTAVGVLLADLDHFKRVNDTLGHLAGDQVLREAAERMRAALRPHDMIGRYGGEEFLVVLGHCGLTPMAEVGERLRRRLGERPFELAGGPLAVTVSAGVAVSGKGLVADAKLLIHAADTALYRAKELGRNRVEVGPLLP